MAHIRVEVTLLPTEHGGRQRGVGQGYRPQFYYAGEDWDANYTFIDTDHVQPGETAAAELVFTNPQYHHGRVFVGMPFLTREGNRVVGYGRVTHVLELEEPARQGVEPNG